MNYFHIVSPIPYNDLRCTVSLEFTFLLFVTWLQQLRTKRGTLCEHSLLSDLQNDADLRANDFITPETSAKAHLQHAWDFIKLIYNIFFFFPVALRTNAGHGLLIHEVSRSHITTHHRRWYSSGRVISSLQRLQPDNTHHSQQTNR